jgi:predicted RNase H-like nuclease (RuvC/YqgF family)
MIGCQSTGTSEKIEQQQYTINNLESRIQKLEGQIQQVQKENIELKKSFSTLKKNVDKVITPSYGDGGVLELSN